MYIFFLQDNVGVTRVDLCAINPQRGKNRVAFNIIECEFVPALPISAAIELYEQVPSCINLDELRSGIFVKLIVQTSYCWYL